MINIILIILALISPYRGFTYQPIDYTKTVEKPVEKPIYEQEIDSPDKVKEYIEWHADFMDVDKDLALDLAMIESTFNHKAQNPNSTAYGPYQFIKSTWKEICQDKFGFGDIKDAKENIGCAHFLIYKGDLHHWLVSKPTKNKLIQLGYNF